VKENYPFIFFASWRLCVEFAAPAYYGLELIDASFPLDFGWVFGLTLCAKTKDILL
jgi:hypothetical protein